MSSGKKRGKRKPGTKQAPKRQSKENARGVEISRAEQLDKDAEIRRLISRGKCKGALSKAKQYHKSLGSEKSEAILVDAYIARIRQMIEKGMIDDARSLAGLVGRRYPWAGTHLVEIKATIAVSVGMIDDLVRPLSDPGISEEDRVAVERVITKELVDLDALAGCKILDSGHPLKKDACAVINAFQAVTTGAVENGVIALPGVSRRSPLAPWKMLVRAISSFYQYNDEICEKSLQAIDPESAPARMVPVIRAMIAGKSNLDTGQNARRLIAIVSGDRENVRKLLQDLDRTLTGENRNRISRMIRQTVQGCREKCPGFLDRLIQHIFVKAWIIELPSRQIIAAVGEILLKDAYFWRLHARAAEIKGDLLFACSLWDMFRRQAVSEDWFAGDSQEVSVIYLHMAELLGRMPADELGSNRSLFEMKLGMSPPHIEDDFLLINESTRNKHGEVDTCFLYPEQLYRLASTIDPAPETFRQWLDWTEKQTSGWKEIEEVAGAWHNAFPADARPLLCLMTLAEKRDALKKALGYLEKAEHIDRLNPDVRRARPRLLAATAIRHLKQKKTHLAKKDFAGLEALPQSRERDHAAFLAGMKSICAVIDKKEAELSVQTKKLVNLLESGVAATVVIKGLTRACRMDKAVESVVSDAGAALPGGDLLDGVARACALGDEMDVDFRIPHEWDKEIRESLAARECSLDSSLIRTIARAALREKNLELVYAASGAGLSRGGTDMAKFMLLRAISLPVWAWQLRDDCIAATIELARRQRDMDTLDEAIELQRETSLFSRTPFLGEYITNRTDSSMDSEKLHTLIEQEKGSSEYPLFQSPAHGSFFDDDDDDDDDFDDDDFDDDDDDDDDFDDDFNNAMIRELMPLFLELASKHGVDAELPDLEELARQDPDLAQRMMEIMTKHMFEGGSIPELEEDWFPGGGRSQKARRKRKKKK
jgi:hypothetical protein